MAGDGGLLRRVEVTASAATAGVKARWAAAPLLAAGQRRVVGAIWRHGSRCAGNLRFEDGDLCLELFDERLWFNLIEVRAAGSQALKGWYINLTTPCRLEPGEASEHLAYVDLALDFTVSPAGRVDRLDGDAYGRILEDLDPLTRRGAQEAAATLERQLHEDAPGFVAGHYAEAAGAPGEAHLLDMVRDYGLPATAHIQLDYDAPGAGHWARAIDAGRRVAEALYLLDQGAGRFLVHTKSFYPGGVPRLPGGGVAVGERPDHAALREALEETGLQADITGFPGYLRTELVMAAGPRVVPTYVFRMVPREPDRAPVPQEEEQITAFLQVDEAGLRDVARRLAGLEGAWRDWGRYRSLQHRIALAGLGAAGLLGMGPDPAAAEESRS